jgi:hypothetical protein
MWLRAGGQRGDGAVRLPVNKARGCLPALKGEDGGLDLRNYLPLRELMRPMG